MGKCILKDDTFVDKEVEVDNHRNIIEVVRNTTELKENPIPETNIYGGYTVALYGFVNYVDGVGIYKRWIKQ